MMSRRDYERGWEAGWDFAVEFFTQMPVVGRPAFDPRADDAPIQSEREGNFDG